MMRRLINAILFFALGLVLITAVVTAQTQPDDEAGARGLVIVPAPELLISGEYVPPAVEEITADQAEVALARIPGSDSCAAASVITLPGGATAVVSNNQTDITDPVLSCTWGTPADSRGFRTSWYQFTSSTSGRVTLSTLGSNFDTILAVFSDDGMNCSDLQQIACDDDHQGFTSEITLPIKRNVTYYVEVADYNSGSSEPATLNLAAFFDTVSKWEVIGSLPPGGLSRHASVVEGKFLYLIGGQYIEDGVPVLSRQLYRYEFETGNWATLAQKPGPGYSNTTAVSLGGRIYLPSGFNGNQTTFDGTHWVYDIPSNSWMEAPSIGDSGQPDWPNGNPLAWSQAVASGIDNRYFFIGGVGSQPAISANADVSDRVYEYSPVLEDWTERAQRMLSPRFAHVATWMPITNRVCVAGGLSANDSGAILLGSAECWDPLGGDGWQIIPDMIYPRYGAAGAVGPDGKWYVFGGIDASGEVPPTEVYSPFSNTWAEMDIEFELGGGNLFPTPAFHTGAFVDNKLWAFGGENFPNGDALSFIVTVPIQPQGYYFPLMRRNFVVVNETLATAEYLNINQRRGATFVSADDRYDVYRFVVPFQRSVTVEVTDIPSSRDYDVSVYDANKLVWATADSLPGNDARVTQTLPAGVYYAVVQRKEPTAPDPDRVYYIRAFFN